MLSRLTSSSSPPERGAMVARTSAATCGLGVIVIVISVRPPAARTAAPTFDLEGTGPSSRA